ncbi:hypothetical protein OO013_03540 [Mangrovivirga sp. M17]|uniref:Uncharacterized protein n=1 Tax=Mangrovivirga halotolerans TaxID=2993936 RepID=A0ABT3RN29_9BACT|nr:hypothetical protein [Mangrovivirga halotolerans]MCX2742923.1 hypothetical protein [Mangrovivirga halotolerans]
MKFSVVTLSLLVIISFFILTTEEVILNNNHFKKATSSLHCTYDYHISSIKSRYDSSTPEDRKYASFWISLMLDRPCSKIEKNNMQNQFPQQASTSCKASTKAG